MDKLPPFTADTSLDLILAVQQAERVSDLGIAALAFMWRWASCSLHGPITDEVEVSSGVAIAEAMVRCWPCHEQFGIHKRCPVESIGPVERE